jgi:hypothetical protein
MLTKEEQEKRRSIYNTGLISGIIIGTLIGTIFGVFCAGVG